MSKQQVENLNERYKRTTNLLFYLSTGFIFMLVAWSFIFEVDIVSNADGQVIPVGEVKTIQHLEGGIIEEILVKESETVEEGQSLVILAPTASETEVDELQVRIDSQVIKSVRLEAEINDFDAPIFPDDLFKSRQEIIDKSMELFISRKNKFEGEIKEINTLIDQKSTSVDILIRQVEMSAKLLEEKITNEFAHLDILKE